MFVETLVSQKDGSLPKRLLDELKWGSIHEQQSHEHIDGVICRICEKLVPPSHLEAHSYVCAFAEKCDVKYLDVNDRLLKFAEILEYIIKCYTSTDYSATCGSPGVSKIQTPFFRGVEGQSPKVNECPNIGVEGMFEDIHEMDTACIDEAHVAASNSCTGMGLKDLFFESLSADCTTPVSSTSTPKATQFNLFWLGLNSLEPENLMQIIFDHILNQKIPWPAVPGEMSYEARDLISRLLVQDPDQRLGANGAPEVKAHPFFKGMNWETLALQKAAFVPNPDNPDDTSYFVSQCSQKSTRTAEDPSSSEDACTISGSSSLSNESESDGDECGDISRFGRSSSRKLSFGSFSFKNLSQLASINYDMLSQNGKDPPSTSCGGKGL